MLIIGVDKHKYVQININNIKYFSNKKVGIKGSGKCLTQLDKDCNIINCDKYIFY